MRQHAGVFWPDSDVAAHRVIPGYLARALPALLPLLTRFGLAVQAGGNVGLYPKALAQHFDKIVTFEPDAENFACLERNLCGVDNVSAYPAALGQHNGRCDLAVDANNSGAHRVVDGDSIEMLCLDSLTLARCDLIWLSVNGYHLEVIEGGARTINDFRPVVIIEETHDDRRGLSREWLGNLGYRQATMLPLRDYVMLP